MGFFKPFIVLLPMAFLLLMEPDFGATVVHVIDREIEIWHLDDATARLEHYPRMDVLVEVEGEPAAIERVVAASGIPRHEFTAESLTEFVRRFEERTGATAELAGGSAATTFR